MAKKCETAPEQGLRGPSPTADCTPSDLRFDVYTRTVDVHESGLLEVAVARAVQGAAS